MTGQGGALAEGLPRALRRAVALDRVPNDLKPDLLFLARLLDPVAARLKAMAPDLPRMAANARGQLEPQADKAYEVSSTVACPWRRPYSVVWVQGRLLAVLTFMFFAHASSCMLGLPSRSARVPNNRWM